MVGIAVLSGPTTKPRTIDELWLTEIKGSGLRSQSSLRYSALAHLGLRLRTAEDSHPYPYEASAFFFRFFTISNISCAEEIFSGMAMAQ